MVRKTVDTPWGRVRVDPKPAMGPNLPAVGDLYNKVARLQRKVRVLTPEPKYSNHIENQVNSSYDGILRTIATTVSQGDTDITREGDQIRLKNCQLKMWFNSGTTSCAVRVIIFIDKQASSAAVTDVLEAGTIGTANGVNAINGLFVHDYESRYRILKDKTFTFSGTGSCTASYRKTFYFKDGLIQEYGAGGTAPIRNALKMIILGNTAAGATPQANWQSRANFIDV